MTNPFTLTKEQYQELYKEVLTFSQIGGVAADEDNLWKMCYEEFIEELNEACAHKDKLAVIDAIADSFVVLVQLHHYYTSKPSWEFRDLFSVVDRTPTWAIKNKDTTFALNCMVHWESCAVFAANQYNFNLYKAIKEVNRSNMTKYPTLKSLVTRYRQDNKTNSEFLRLLAYKCEDFSDGKYKNVKAEIVFHSETDNDFHGKEYVVFRENFGKGKVCKPMWAFQEPNFEDCWL